MSVPLTVPAPTTFVPSPFGKYFLIDKIATGGMAEIFKAKSYSHGGFEHLLVIKRILPHIGENAEFVEMFIDEAKVSVALVHSNVIRIYDFGKINENFFIAMECCDGKDCRNILRKLARGRRWIPMNLTANLAHEVARGLHYAHTKNDANGKPYGIVHRDISPSNVLVAYEGDIKIADFGIAKAESNAYQTKDGVLKGKFEYMSPEQANGTEVDARSDVFSLGIILWECLTGRRLFKGESETATLRKIREDEIPPPSRVNPQVAPELDRIALRALERDLSRRYQTAQEMADDLRDYLLPATPDRLKVELAQFMQDLFAEELVEERGRLQAGSAAAGQYKEKLAAEGWEGQTNSTMGATPSPPAPQKAGSRLPMALAGVVILGLLGVVGIAGAALALRPDAAQVEAPAAPTVGSVDILVVPAAKITIDGVDQGKHSDLTIADLAPGPHAIHLEADGFQALDESVTVEAGKPVRLVRQLVKAVPTGAAGEAAGPGAAEASGPPVVTFKSTPSGATVKVDGQVIGTTPFAWKDAEVGKSYAVVYSKDGADIASGTLRAKPGPSNFSLNAEKASNDPGKLTVTLAGGGWANVYVDGQKLAKTAPLKDWSLPPGKHTIRVENAALGIDTTQDVKVDSAGSVTVRAAPK